MKTTLDLPNELVMAAKVRAVLQGRTLKDLVAEYLRQGLALGESTVAKPEPSLLLSIGENGLPVVRSKREAPARKMSVEKLLALEQQAQSQEDAQRVGFTF